ncbi:acyltransferase [Phyllobacterium salinisoli]|uniref:Acyltransferase n=1 Tax=Phyllobacterium salinisoli TaxID=1899321 RepID=A0A368K8G8_9HYPH|nr:acyltransferase [Phyllobacterium salinisoli]RCS25656.1 acyltransferase [Phyllobacterium salinisoli]
MNQLRSIQVLRAIAALAVVFFHLSPSSWTLGAAGVDLFFVISGFIMGTVGLRDSPGSFMSKRIVRIVPLYWAVTFAMCAVSLVPGLFSNFTFDMPRLFTSLFFIPFEDPQGKIWPLIVVGWTLNYEMFFYVLFALGLWLRRPIVAPVVAISGLVAAGWIFQPEQTIPHFYTNALLLEFAFGLLLSRAVFFKNAALGSALAVAGFIGILSLGLGSDTPDWRIIYWGLPAVAIVAGFVAIERAGMFPGQALLRPLERLGDASYSLYLTHGIVLGIISKFVGHGSVSSILIALTACIAVAMLSYYLFERPIGQILRGLITRPTRPKVAA